MMTCETCTFTGSWLESPLLYWTAGTVRTTVPPISASAARTWPHFHANVRGSCRLMGGGEGEGGAVVFLCEHRHKSWMLSGLKTKTAWVPQQPSWAPLTEAPSLKQKPQGFSKPPNPTSTLWSPSHPISEAGESIYGQDLQPPRIQALEKLVALLTERCLEQWGESLGALGALWPAPPEYKRRWWQHVAGIKKFHCGLKSFQRL